MKEIYKDIKEYEGLYQISNYGNVKSLPRVVTRNDGTYTVKERILKQHIGTTGYYTVSLKKNGKCKTHKVHQLVAIAFLNHKPDGYKIVVDHIDNNNLNNRVDNLQLISNRENTSKDRKGVSKYTGVCWNKPLNKWQSAIVINSKLTHLGYFIDEKRASEQYQLALSNINKFENPKQFRDLINSLFEK